MLNIKTSLSNILENSMTTCSIIFSSAYEQYVPDSFAFIQQEEVRHESETIKGFFREYREFIIPAGRLSTGELNKKSFLIKQLINQLEPGTQINLILNTHGVPGAYDIDERLIVETVKFINSKTLRVRKIYALMCHGFTEPKGVRRMAFFGISSGMKEESSMSQLARKLKKLEVQDSYTFNIVGFNRYYDPREHKLLVTEVLRDNAGESLSVYFSLKQQNTAVDIKNIRSALHFISRASSSVDDKDWNKNTTILGKVLALMLKNIVSYLDGFEPLEESSQALFETIKEHSNMTSISQSTVFVSLYHQWAKIHKLKSDEKKRVIEAYCVAKAPQLINSQNAQIGFFEESIDKSIGLNALMSSIDESSSSNNNRCNRNLFAQKETC